LFVSCPPCGLVFATAAAGTRVPPGVMIGLGNPAGSHEIKLHRVPLSEEGTMMFPGNSGHQRFL